MSKFWCQVQLVALLLCVALWAGLPQVAATCNKCYTAHACTGRSTYQICYDGQRSETTHTCPEDKPICTGYGTVCMPESLNVPQGCGDVSQCSSCNANKMFACTSLNTFAKCDGDVVTNGRQTCEGTNICSVSGAASGQPCVNQCKANSEITCDRVEENGPVTTVPPSTTVTTTAVPSNNAFCADKRVTGRFAIPGDTVCKSYIYCSLRDGTWQATVYTCGANLYYNATATVCKSIKPTKPGCI